MITNQYNLALVVRLFGKLAMAAPAIIHLCVLAMMCLTLCDADPPAPRAKPKERYIWIQTHANRDPGSTNAHSKALANNYNLISSGLWYFLTQIESSVYNKTKPLTSREGERKRQTHSEKMEGRSIRLSSLKPRPQVIGAASHVQSVHLKRRSTQMKGNRDQLT